MPEGHENSPQFDLTPHPRILPMLGEIVLPQWRCLAELIDNSVDSFLEAHRAGCPVTDARVSINLPTSSSHDARLSVRDNGPGMEAEILERAARAGWTSHDPINNLGLFGMGFNIATARLGLRTTIWTTKQGDREWVGLEVDFEQLTHRQAFMTPALVRPKADPEVSGTEIVVGRLKPEQTEWFSRAYNRSNVSKQLGRTYSSMLGPGGEPVGFRLDLNGNQIRPRLHCIWGGPGNPERVVETSRHGAVNAFQPFDVRLDPRPFCTQCWNWLGLDQTSCPSCERSESVVQRPRRVHGWLGIQRYLDRNEYGIDILRNGRKIELGNKDLFRWQDENTGTEETEYPIDDPRDRGRIVGEIHLDHCRVPYTKDRFVREDTVWREMVEIVHGLGPLRPDIASRMGAGENNSVLYRLFQAFRRSNPHNRRAGGWNRILVVPDNDRAQAMARRCQAGEGEYQTDERWWELIEEAEAQVLQGSTRRTTTGETLGGTGEAVESPGETSATTETRSENQQEEGAPSIPPSRNRLASLSQQYTDDLTSQRFRVEAFGVAEDDPEIGQSGAPWAIRRTTAGPWEFYICLGHEMFMSMTMIPLDALLSQLAWLAADFERGQASGHGFAAILASLRLKYATATKLDPSTLISEAAARLVEIGRSIAGHIIPTDARAFFDELAPARQESVRVAMASRGVAEPQDAIDDGRFLQYASPRSINQFVLAHPERFFDGCYWDDRLDALDYGSAAATEEARSRVLGYFGGLLADVVWLAQQTSDDLESMSRERLMRASLATSLLSPTGNIGDTD